MKNWLKRILIVVLALAMVLPMPLEALAAPQDPTNLNALPVEPAKPASGKAADVLTNPDQPDLYTLYTDYKVERGEDNNHKPIYDINYQPYVARVGEAAKQPEKDKVNRDVPVPVFDGYEEPDGPHDPATGNPFKLKVEGQAPNKTFSFHITYDTIKNAALEVTPPKGDAEYGKEYEKKQEFRYAGKERDIEITYVFQDLNDFNKYGNKPGESEPITRTQKAKTGQWMKINPLPEAETKGYVPDNPNQGIWVPEVVDNIKLEYRYNRAHLRVSYNTEDGTVIPARTVFYGQKIPHMETIPERKGCKFQGWKPSVELKGTYQGNPVTFKANEVMKDDNHHFIKKLDFDLEMPAEDLVFTADWEEGKLGDYVVQFWAQRADDPEIYDYIGSHVHKNASTTLRPDLKEEPIDNINFPDLETQFGGDRDVRIKQIWAQKDGRAPYFNKFYKYNEDRTKEKNKDDYNPTLVKKVSATGKTVYDVYYDRQVYTLYFTRHKNQDTFFPKIKKVVEGKTIVGVPGKPYQVKVRFNQFMSKLWPNDILDVSGFKPGYSSIGWRPNCDTGGRWYDTPPYRLTADDFLDNNAVSAPYKIYTDKGDNDYRWGGLYDISLGIRQQAKSYTHIHHIDFLMDMFEPGKAEFNYDLYNVKSDVGGSYGHPAPTILGFTRKYPFIPAKFLTEDDIGPKNDERQSNNGFKGPKYTDQWGYELYKGEMRFYYCYPDEADEWGDPKDGVTPLSTNGYIKFEYSRNKYNLKLNEDPRVPHDESYYDEGNRKRKVFYDYTLRGLGLDATTPERPDWADENWVFKGWALDPAGHEMIFKGNAKMPARELVIYAIWEEIDVKHTVSFDPDGGQMADITADALVKDKKTINEGTGQNPKPVTYPVKEANDGDKQVFTVLERQKLEEPKAKPKKSGYSFLGWEVVRYVKDEDGKDTDVVDDSYLKAYGVPELYPFGTEVAGDVTLKAIWVENGKVDVKVYHHFLDQALWKDKTIAKNPKIVTLEDQTPGQYTSAVGNQQGKDWMLVPHSELVVAPIEPSREIKDLYAAYNKRLPFNNTFIHLLLVEAEKISVNGKWVDNWKAKFNHFHFFYRPFRISKYKVNYLDERVKAALEERKSQGGGYAELAATTNKYRLLNQEEVKSPCRDYDARNYKPIKGWVLVSDPQQQLFFDVNKKTNNFEGINGTGSDEITFYYKDVRVIEVKEDDPVPDGYVRVTFKAAEGGSFGKDKDGNPIKQINYDVIKGLKSELLPVPQQWFGGLQNKKKYYITPDPGKSFVKWDDSKLLPKGTEIKNAYTFTAYFDDSTNVPSPNGPSPNGSEPEVPEVKKPEKINGYYPFRPYFLAGKNSCQMVRDWGEDDVKEMLDQFNAHANWYKENHVPDVDQIAEHINMHGYELIAKEYSNEYGTLSFRFGKPVTLAEWKNLLNKDSTLKARFADPAEQAIDQADEAGNKVMVHNKTYYVPIYIDYKPKTYKVYWDIVPNKTSIEQAMGYWPGRDINEEYDRLVGGSPFNAEFWAIKHIGKPDPCKPNNQVAFPLPDYRTHDKAGLWFYAPESAPKAVKVKGSNPIKYKVTFEYIFAGTETYQKYYRKK